MIWHSATARQALAELDSSERGLDAAEAARRLAEVGPNRLPERPPPSGLEVFLRQFRSPLIYILGVAGAVSAAIGEVTDAGFIFAVLLLNAVIGAFQEGKAERSSRALQKLVRTRATVSRDGEAREVDGEEVVPGDVVWLEPGSRVPADLRLLHAHGLELDESLLTGESLAVYKDAEWTGEEEAAVGDRLNMAYAGAMVTRGRGRGVAVATGSGTEVGRLASEMNRVPSPKPPLLLRLERFTRVIGVAVLIAASLVSLAGVVLQARSAEEMFLVAVALAVSAIPEGLPVALTVALAVATTRMARRGVIVRRLAAVEGLGSCTLIATDKTGTLTCNQLTARAAMLPHGPRYAVTGEGYAPEGTVEDEQGAVEVRPGDPLDRLARVAALTNEAQLYMRDGEWAWRGDPTDVALLSFAHKLGRVRSAAAEQYPEIAQIPFEPEHRYAASFHEDGDGALVLAKGAPERIAEMCAWPDGAERERALEQAAALAREGYRVLAFAEGREHRALRPEHAPPEPIGLTFLGFVGMIDPLRPGVREAVQRCHRAGIGVKMVTGDHPVTALAISRDLGLAETPEQVVTGPELARATVEERAELVAGRRVFARVSPEQKLDIVEAARRAGELVAVTGDGVNDAPALRASDIGVAMGKAGTDVARDAAELVISDDDFATIVAGVEEGRVAYDNVRKVIYLLVSTGAAEVVLVTLAMATGTPLPLLPVQLLWLNLVTNGIQDVALAFEPKEADVLDRPPRRPRERVFNRLMTERTLLAAVVIGALGFAVFWWMLDAGWSEPEARNALLLLMVLFENVHVGNSRSETRSLFAQSPLRSPILLGGVVLAFSIHVLAMHFGPAQHILGTAPLSIEHWFALVAIALSIAVVMELHKASWALRYGRRGRRSVLTSRS